MSVSINGTNGLTFNDASTQATAATGFGFKNRIQNGSMVVDQRNAGASQTITAAAALAYTVDRWYGYCTGANVTGQQVAGSGAVQNRYRFTGAASVTAVGFGQRIEQKNSYDLAGSTCTLSADLAISATLTTVTWTAYYATTTADTFGSLASPTVTSIATGTFTVSSTVTNFTTNISIPAAATTGIQILFTVGALTAGLTWTIGNVQLEKGSTATSFDYRPYGTELALCQRYYEKNDASATNAVFAIGYSSSTTDARYVWFYKVPKRSAATVSTSTAANFYGQTGAGSNVAAVTLGGILSGSNQTSLSATFASGFTAGQGSQLLDNNAGASWIAASAEL